MSDLAASLLAISTPSGFPSLRVIPFFLDGFEYAKYAECSRSSIPSFNGPMSLQPSGLFLYSTLITSAPKYER